MNSGDPNKAEIELDISGDAVDQAKALAKALDDAADAEERLQKEMAKRSRVLSGLAKQRVQEEGKTQRDADRTQREAEQRKSRVTSGLAGLKARELAREQQQQQKAQERQQRTQESQTKRQRQQEEREAVEAERRKNRVTSGLARQREQELGKVRRERERSHERVMKEAEREEKQRETRRANTPEAEARRRFAGMKREELVRSRLDAMTGKNAPKSGLAGLQQAAESKLGMKAGGLDGVAGKVGRFAGPAAGMAAFAAAGKFAVDTGMTVNNQLQHGNPYADDFTRGREVLNNLPGADKFFAASDLVTGRSQAIGKENRRRGEEDVGARLTYQQYEAEAEQKRKERAATLNARSVRDIPLPRVGSTARTTVEEKRQYDLAQRMLPLQERRAEAERATAEATNEQTANLERLKSQEQRLADLRRQKAGVEQRFKGWAEQNAQRKYLWDPVKGEQGSAEYVAGLGDQTRIGRELQQAEQSRTALRERLQASTQSTAAARYQQRQAEQAISAGRLDDLRRREGVASSQAESLSYAGIEGREMAKHSMRVARQAGGISNLPQEIVGSARAFFPEEVREMAEREGQVHARDFRKEFGTKDYRDDLTEVRRSVDTAEEGVREQREGDTRNYKDEIVEGIRSGGLPDGRELGKELAEQFKQMIKDAKDQLAYEMMLGAYGLPSGGG
jgi:hypothetical protein